jgi:hypothetical protein
MSRLKAKTAQKRPRETWQSTFEDLSSRVSNGQVIPIVGTAVFYEQIFDMDADGLLDATQDEADKTVHLSLEEQLADAWADRIGFPLPLGTHRMAQVALYNRVRSRDDIDAKKSYLNFLKEAMLILAEDDPAVDNALIDEQMPEIDRDSSFSDIAVELGYPHPAPGQPDAINQLAKLNLPIYVTTSYFDFLERAILANGRTPRTQVCFWSGDPATFQDESHRTDYDFVPTAENPLVYHLFGLEAYPRSLVLTEDDHLEFLAKIVRDSGSQNNARLPWYLSQALTQSSLILLGYQLHDWDFRILIRALINTAPQSVKNPDKFNVAIQLDPNKPGIQVNLMKSYLQKYFNDQLRFTVEYGTTAHFINQLWEAWNKWR